jgi:plasmid stabilization system protein ParE
VPRLVFTHSAQINLMQIADYIENTNASLAVAEHFTSDLMIKCQELAGLPGTMGLARPELLADLRSTPYGNYVIFFRYVGDAFEVVNILEGHRDIEGYFKNRS